MIAVIIFLAANAEPVIYHSPEAFPTLAACEAHLVANLPRLETVRAAAEERLGQELRMVALCVDQGVLA